MQNPNRLSEESITQFFARKDNYGKEIERANGPFKGQADKLLMVLRENKDLLKKQKIAGDMYPATPVVYFTHGEKLNRSSWKSEGGKTGKAAAYTDQIKGLDGPESRLYVAIDPDVSDPEMHRVLVNRDGHVLDIDDIDADLEGNEVFANAFKAAVDKIGESLEGIRGQKAERRKKVSRVAVASTVTVATLAAVGASGTYAVNEWIIKPREEDRLARAEFDAEEHELPGDTLSLESIEAKELPASMFDIIPEYKDEDDLSSPRKIDITMNTCKELDFKPVNGQELAVAIRDGSILVNSKVTARINHEGKIDLCVDDTGNDLAEEAPVAIQVLER